MKKSFLLIPCCLLLAGCSSKSAAQNHHAGCQYAAVTGQPASYHHELISEPNEGDTKFLVLVPGAE